MAQRPRTPSPELHWKLENLGELPNVPPDPWMCRKFGDLFAAMSQIQQNEMREWYNTLRNPRHYSRTYGRPFYSWVAAVDKHLGQQGNDENADIVGSNPTEEERKRHEREQADRRLFALRRKERGEQDFNERLYGPDQNPREIPLATFPWDLPELSGSRGTGGVGLTIEAYTAVLWFLGMVYVDRRIGRPSQDVTAHVPRHYGDLPRDQRISSQTT